MKSRLLLPWSLLVGLFYLISNAEAARATTLILGKSKPEPKIDTPPTAEEENIPVPATSNLSNETINVGNVTKLTGVPQIDYIYDPNLPRELNGYNLTDYPFYNSVPEDIDFKCDGLHDGFYASVPHKCQVYHHCLFGTRYDFLCANYTAFDQKTFICHFASEVDCKNSPRYFNRNEALYKATTTTTVPPFASSGLAARKPQDSQGGRRRRPFRKRKPSYEYYDEYEDLAEDDYYDEGSRKRKRPRPVSGRDSYDEGEEGDEGEKPVSSVLNKSVYDRPRVAPKIRRPVPVNEREKYDYSGDSRVIVKEPVVEKKRFEDAEAGKKPSSNKAPDFYESTGSGHSKNKEPETERERERKEDDYDREKERDRERERERERDRERDGRPYRDRRPPKKRRRPDGLDDEYDEYDDVRRYRNRNKPRYEEYEDYEYDERPYRRNRDPEYRLRDHDYDRDRNYRNRDSEYDRPRNRERIRDDDRPIRNRDTDERPIRIRDEDRPPRTRDEERPIRNRELDKLNYKEQDDRLNRKNKNRHRDEDRGYYSDEEGYRDRVKETYRDEARDDEMERPYKYKEEDDEADRYRDRNRNQNRPTRYRDNADKFKNRAPSRDEEEGNNGRLRPADQTERPYRNNDRGVVRPLNGQRTRILPSSQEEELSSEDQSKPVPASRPAYITKPTEAPGKQFNDQSARKPTNFKKPLLSRTPSVPEDSSGEQEKERPTPSFEELPVQTNQYQERPFERPHFQTEVKEPQIPKFIPAEDLRGTIEQLNDKLQPIKPNGNPQTGFSQPKLKVPHEDSVPKEELAPRAPKFPQTTTRRRPFLPSRNGNSPLPRNLLPVGVKSLQTPRGFQAQNAKPESEQEAKPETYQYPTNGGVEFRAKVSTAIGVDQPKLTQFFQDVQQSSELELPDYETNPANPSAVDADYVSDAQKEERPVNQDARPLPGQERPINNPNRQELSFPGQERPINNPNTQELSSSHVIPEYSSGQKLRQESNPVNFRPTLKPTDFPQLVTDGPSQENRNLEQTFRNRQLPSAINQQFNQHFTTKTPILYPSPPKPAAPQTYPQLGPQGFYSENPKFKTTVKIPEPFPYKPTPPNVNFNQGTHLPVFQAGIRPNPKPENQNVRYDNAQRQIDPPQESLKPLNLKFPSQSDNLDDSDEFDVSLNDALQPISTLHPRNVPTGVYFSNWQRNPQFTNNFKRRVFQGASPVRQESELQEYNTRREEFSSRAADSRNVPTQQKNLKTSVQRQSSSNVFQRYVYPPVSSVTNHGKYYAILTQ